MSILQEISGEEFSAILNRSRKNTRIRPVVFPPEAKEPGARKSLTKHSVHKLKYLPTKKPKAAEIKSGEILTPLGALAKKPAARKTRKTEKNPQTEYKKGDLSKRANNLFFSQAYKKALIYHNPGSALMEKYTNSLKCATLIKKDAEGISSRYCGSRWCNVCNRIATGKAINKHGQKIAEILDPWFITLTIPNVPGAELSHAAKNMSRTFAKIIEAYQIRQKRRGLQIVKGLRKIETTCNDQQINFHPHLHIIVDTEAAAQYILRAWLHHYPEASILGQDIKPATMGATLELFKYVTKMLPNKAKDQTWTNYFQDDTRIKLFFEMQDQIYKAIQGLRTFQTFGFEKQDQEAEIIEIDTEQDQGAEEMKDLKKTDNYEGIENASPGRYVWEPGANNWIDHTTGEELLQNYRPPPNLVKLIELFSRNNT